MTNELKELESTIVQHGEKTDFASSEIAEFPTELGLIHDFNLFGADLLALPAEYLIEGDDEENETPFRFIQDQNELDVFEEEFRPEIPLNFIQIGYLYGASEIVLLNKETLMVHIFHVSDVSDPEWLKHKLQDELSSLSDFIKALRPQTVSCFMNPADASQYDMLEIRKNKVVFGFDYESENGEFGEIENENKAASWDCYLEQIKKSTDKGFELHYGPKQVKIALGLN